MRIMANYGFNRAIIRTLYLIIVGSTVSNAFVIFKTKPAKDVINTKEQNDISKRASDTVNTLADSNTLSASSSTGSLALNLVQGTLESMQNSENANDSCVPFSQVLDQVSGAPFNGHFSDTRGSHYTPPSYHSFDPTTRHCPSELLDVTGLYSIHHNSLCPWTYVQNDDNERYPVRMMYAQCHCPYCINTSTNPPTFDSTVANTCRPVLHKVRVLRRCEGSSPDGEHMYRHDFELVPVACTCTRPRTL